MPRILAVCTGNVCRSPFLEQLLRFELDRGRLIEAGRPLDKDPHGSAGAWTVGVDHNIDIDIDVASAGTRAPVGAGLDPRTARTLRAAGVEPTDHAAHQLLSADVAAADLVLTATREHRAAVVRAHPAALRYAFTAMEFARLALLVDLVQLPERPADRLGALVRAAAARRGSVAPPEPGSDDIPDPAGAPDEVYVEVADRLATVVEILVGRLNLVSSRVTGEAPTNTAPTGTPPTRIVPIGAALVGAAFTSADRTDAAPTGRHRMAG